jgi:hypothetical protein
MQASVNVFAASFLVITAQLALLVVPAHAQEPVSPSDVPSESEAPKHSRRPGGDRWVPSLAVTSGITFQDWNAEVSSTCSGCTNPPAQPPARPSASGDDADVTPFVGGQLELMTPELPIPTSPRFFVGGGLLAAFGRERDVAIEGNVGTLTSPLPADFDPTIFPESAVIGQGSDTQAQMVDDWIYEAHAGIAFPLEFLGRQFRLKPSVGWVRYEVEAKGAISDAECRVISAGATNCNALSAAPNQGVLRSVQLRAKDTGSFNGVGGGFDLEMDVFRIGQFGSALSIGAHAYSILGEREIEFGASKSFPDSGFAGLGAADYSSTHRVEVDPVLFRAALGFRIQWLGGTQ